MHSPSACEVELPGLLIPFLFHVLTNIISHLNNSNAHLYEIEEKTPSQVEIEQYYTAVFCG
jgi:hypothetical protein